MASAEFFPFQNVAKTLVRKADIATAIGAMADDQPLTMGQMALLQELAFGIGCTAGIALIDPACHPLTAAAIRDAENINPIPKAAVGLKTDAAFFAKIVEAKHAPWSTVPVAGGTADRSNTVVGSGRTIVVAASEERLDFMCEAARLGLNKIKLSKLTAGRASKQLLAMMFTADDASMWERRWAIPEKGRATDLELDLIANRPDEFKKLRPELGWLVFDVAKHITNNLTGGVREVLDALLVAGERRSGYIADIKRSRTARPSEVIARRALGFMPRDAKTADAGEFACDPDAHKALIRAMATAVSKSSEERKV